MDTINTNCEAVNNDEDREGEPDVSWRVAGVQAKSPGGESESEALQSAREVMTNSMSSSGTFNSKPMFEHGDRFVCGRCFENYDDVLQVCRGKRHQC